MFRTDMAAAWVRTTKGLFFTVTLLSLICCTSSLLNKDKLAKFRELHQKREEEMDMLTAQYTLLNTMSSDFMSEFIEVFDPIIAMFDNSIEALSDFPAMDTDLEAMKNSLENTKDLLEKTKEKRMIEFGYQREHIDQVIYDTQQKMKKFYTFIRNLEKLHDEL